MDTTDMDTTELYAYCGMDGSKWAEAFCQRAKKFYDVDLDEGWVIGWFANAIVHSQDLANGTVAAAEADALGEAMEALEPDLLDVIADEIECFEHGARCASLRSLAKRQRAVLALLAGEGGGA